MYHMKPDLGQLLQIDGGALAATSPEQAYALCQGIATGHYENFPVASLFLPRRMRRHLMAIYAFARIADDVADEPWATTRRDRLRALTFLDHLARQAQHHVVHHGHPVLVALSHSMRDACLPLRPFLDLLEAFRRDVRWVRPDTWAEVMAYCELSANPVGRLVLRTAGVTDPRAYEASDAICTALQLVNFWQDLSVDKPRGREYLPGSLVRSRGETEALREAFAVTRELFRRGREITRYVGGGRLSIELSFVINGGLAVLDACERSGDGCFRFRPSLTRSQYLQLALRSIFGVRRQRSLTR